MSEPVRFPVRVRKLLPLLASGHDGEVVGTAQAIGRTLSGAGLDWHALAAAVPVDEPKAEPSREREYTEAEEAYPAWRERRAAWDEQYRQQYGHGPRSYGNWRETWARRHRQRRNFTPLQEARQRDQIRFCQGHSDRLGPRERAFINDIAKILDGLTLAQNDWLVAIVDRVEQEVRLLWQ